MTNDNWAAYIFLKELGLSAASFCQAVWVTRVSLCMDANLWNFIIEKS